MLPQLGRVQQIDNALPQDSFQYEEPKEHLDRHQVPAFVLGEVHDTEAALTDLLQQLVVADLVALALGAVCGDVMIWKPSPRTPLTALAVQQIANRIMREHDCEGVFNLLVGDADVGSWLSDNKDIPLVSFTGSTAVGRKIVQASATNLKRVQLELGGKGAALVLDDADPRTAIGMISSVWSFHSGQICTAPTRAIVHRSIYDEVVAEMHMVAEGVKSTRAVLDLAARHRVELPIAAQVGAVLYEGRRPEAIVPELMLRGATSELRGLR